jgi:uncharacterized RDD family membrane protein YckC
MSQQYESAPQAPPEPAYSAGGASGPRASFGRRLVAAIVDVLVLAIPTIILAIIFRNSPGLYYLFSTVMSLGYYTYFEGGPKGQTVGKMALGIRVYDLSQGGPIGYGRGLLRQIGKYISAIPIFLGYFWMLWDKENQCWQDKIAGSVVVPADAYR